MRPERCQPSPDPTDNLRAMLETVLERQERLEAMLAQLLPMPDPVPEPQPVPPLVQALAVAFGAAGFTSREAWERARTSDGALWVALETEGIRSVHHLGRWLGNHRSAGVERSTVERDGCLWHCDPRSL